MTEIGVLYLRQADQILSGLIDHVKPHWSSSEDNEPLSDYESLVRSITSQQLSTASSTAIFSRLRALTGRPGITPKTISTISTDDLKNVGLSPQKMSYIRDLSAAVLKRDLDLERFRYLEDNEAIEQLQEIRGIGKWTAQMFAMFQLSRNDIFPMQDAGIRKSIRKLYGLDPHPSDDELSNIAIHWSPWRTLACKFLWKALDIGYYDLTRN